MTEAPTSSAREQVTPKSLSLQAAPAFLLHNLPFLLALVAGHLPSFLRVLVAGSILFIVPGLVWVDRRRQDGFVVIFRVVLYSLLAVLGSWLIAFIVPGGPHRLVVVGLLCLMTNVGLVRGLGRDYYDATPLKTPLMRGLALCAALFFMQSYMGAAHFVPPLEDQDMETQGTAYGLMHHLEPTMVTNRGKYHFFAHPLLLHFWIGWSALILDDLDGLRYFHESVRAVQALPGANDLPPLDPNKAGSPLAAKIKQMFDVTPEFGAVLEARWKQDSVQFYKTPMLLATRTPNIFLAALTLFPLGFLVYRISGSRAAAFGSAVVYSTLPEVYVRSSYGGYMAMTNFIMLSGAYFYLQSSGLLPDRMDAAGSDGAARKRASIAGYLGALANQKWLLVAAAIGLHATIRLLSEASPAKLFARARQHPGFVTAVMVTVAFFAGWASYAVYGLIVAPKDFIGDHLIEHVLKRFRMNDVNLTTVEHGGWVYPSILALWAEFCGHLNWLIAGVGVLALGRAFGRVRGPEGLFLIWFLIGAVGFSLIDWRMTKHLGKIIPPLIVLCGLLWASCHGRVRAALTVVLGVALVWNIWTVAHVMQNFEYIKASPIW
jgi:hypothetical protein